MDQCTFFEKFENKICLWIDTMLSSECSIIKLCVPIIKISYGKVSCIILLNSNFGKKKIRSWLFAPLIDFKTRKK